MRHYDSLYEDCGRGFMTLALMPAGKETLYRIGSKNRCISLEYTLISLMMVEMRDEKMIRI
jgi:hypothetical protein